MCHSPDGSPQFIPGALFEQGTVGDGEKLEFVEALIVKRRDERHDMRRSKGFSGIAEAQPVQVLSHERMYPGCDKGIMTGSFRAACVNGFCPARWACKVAGFVMSQDNAVRTTRQVCHMPVNDAS